MLNSSYDFGAHCLINNVCSNLDIHMGSALSCFFEDVDIESIIDRAGELLDSPELLRDYEPNLEINVYPSRTQTKEIHEELLCFCLGKQRLANVLSKIDAFTDDMINKYGEESSRLRSVVLFTNKWDENTFEHYEKSFVKKAEKNNIWFVFFLVSDAGIEQIPFLPNSRNEISGLEAAKEERQKIQSYLTERDRVIYPASLSYSYSGGTWAQTERYTYEFNTMNGSWVKYPLIGNKEDGSIPRSAFERFLRTIRELMKESADALKPELSTKDSARFVLEMDGEEIEWYGSDLYDNIAIQKLQEAIDRFIEVCEKHKR